MGLLLIFTTRINKKKGIACIVSTGTWCHESTGRKSKIVLKQRAKIVSLLNLLTLFTKPMLIKEELITKFNQFYDQITASFCSFKTKYSRPA